MAKEDNSGGNEDSDGASSEHHSERESGLHKQQQQPAKKKRKAVSYNCFIVGYRVHDIIFLQVTRKVCKKRVNPAKDDGDTPGDDEPVKKRRQVVSQLDTLPSFY
jgi:hypothetical protein